MTTFLIKGENLVLLVPNQSPPPPMKNQNSGNFNHKGIEVSVKYVPDGNFTLKGSYNYLNMDSPKVSSPVHQFMTGARYQYKKWSGSLWLRHYGILYTKVTSQSNASESFSLLSGNISFRVNKWSEMVLSGENLLNQEYQMQYGYPMPGLTMFFGVNFLL